jgi:hypothetical protein
LLTRGFVVVRKLRLAVPDMANVFVVDQVLRCVYGESGKRDKSRRYTEERPVNLDA